MTEVIVRRTRVPEDAVRPYRIWDSNNKRDLRYRYYVHAKRCHMAALIECRYSKEHTVLEVYNAKTGALLVQYKRLAHSVAIIK